MALILGVNALKFAALKDDQFDVYVDVGMGHEVNTIITSGFEPFLLSF